jgi:hypothetical protein
VSPTPPTVLLDRSFVEALRDDAHEAHARVVECYRELVDDYEARRIRLRARTDVLGRRDPLFAPVERIHIAAQHRRAASRLVRSPIGVAVVVATDPSIGHAIDPAIGESGDPPADVPVLLDEDTALTLVLMRREGITRIATLDATFDAFELTVFPAA